MTDQFLPATSPVPATVLTVGFVGSLGRGCFSDLLLRAAPCIEPAYRCGSRRALLAALAAGQIDIAVYPGAPATGGRTRHLCDDRLVVAIHTAHPGASVARWSRPGLGAAKSVMAADGDAGDFRRIVRSILPELGSSPELPLRDLMLAIGRGDTIGVISAGHVDELGHGIVTREIAGADTRFALHLSWSMQAPRAIIDDLIGLCA